MGFVQAGFLTAAVAVALPIIIHLVFGQRARRVDLGTLRFLRVALSENMRRRRIKRWLLLALRMAAVLLLAILFARPFLVALQRRGNDQLVVVLIDRSASMSLEGPQGQALEAAVDRAGKILKPYGAGAEVKVAYFDHAVHSVNLGSDDWENPEVSGSSTDYGAALAWARDICVQSTLAKKNVHLLTDLQRCGLGRTPAEPLPDDVRVDVVDLGAPYPRNAAVTRVTPSRLVVRPGESVRVNATILNAGQFAIEKLPIVLHLEHDQRQRNWRTQVDLEPGASDTVEFELPDLERGVWQGYAMAEIDDELAFDNRRHFAVTVRPPFDVLVVDGDPTDAPMTSETYFLESAIRLAPPGEVSPESPYVPRLVSTSSGKPLPSLANVAVVVLANVESLSDSDARRLVEYVESGGRLLIFSGDRDDARLFESLAAKGLTLGEIVDAEPTGGLVWRLESWQQDHPVLAPFADPQHGDLRRLMFNERTAIRPAADVQVLARFRDDTPALIERDHGSGKVLWFASACDRDWSDWPRSRLYVPVVHQLLGYLTGLTEGGPIRVRETDDFEPSESVPAPGVYDRGDYHEVVTIDPRESETDHCSIADLAKQFRFNVKNPDDESTNLATAGIAGRELRQDEVWYWVLLILLGVLLLEGVVANRSTA